MVTPLLWAGWSFVILPSGQPRLMPADLTAFPGIAAPAFKSNTRCAKAVKYKLFGRSSTVRGVAKNPNDHPHGGRTKTIKTPLTPWGRVAKKSRKPQTTHKLRPLAKRRKKTVLSS